MKRPPVFLHIGGSCLSTIVLTISLKATKESTTEVGYMSTSAEENTDKELKFI